MEHTDKPYKYAVHHTEEEGKKTRKMIWNIFWVLLAITSIEVLLGIFWKDMSLNWHFVKMTFIIMTIAKAYFIVAYYMHLKHERGLLRNAIIIPFVLITLYVIYHILTEGMYDDFIRHYPF